MEFVFITDGNIVYELIENPMSSEAKFDHIAYVSKDIEADYNYFKDLDSSLLLGEIGYVHFLFKTALALSLSKVLETKQSSFVKGVEKDEFNIYKTQRQDFFSKGN